MKSTLRPAFVLFAALTLICCVLYPYVITSVGKIAFANEISGSLVTRDGQPVGSRLIGQAFSSNKYFWGRPSATSPQPNNAAASSGSNQGPLNQALVDAVRNRLDTLRAADPGNTASVPVDLISASASGLDPHISLAAANYQVARVTRVNGIPEAQVRALVQQHTEGVWLGFLGEQRVNVLELNLALDAVSH